VSRIKHIEIAGVDGNRLQAYYAELFGWDITHRDVGGFDYHDIDLPGELTGGIRHEPNGKPEIVIYVEVDDLEGSIENARALGGSVRIPPTHHGDFRFALMQDPEGNPVGLTQRRDDEQEDK
jgi:predicted enzyme related to lactoylglutathione lyase